MENLPAPHSNQRRAVAIGYFRQDEQTNAERQRGSAAAKVERGIHSASAPDHAWA
jgi:hypothetical protein